MNQENCQTEIIQKTTGEIQTFLDELANRTSNYKSLHNLTEQVEHQYNGRFLIELIQNAHDAMNEREENADQGRLEILITHKEEPYGALYVANDGRPFTRTNFEALSNLGQSDKDPEKAIGNKGIGFRSVLEITTSPEIYSRISNRSKTFDGYCFTFTPDVKTLFEKTIKELLGGNENISSPLDQTISLVDWSHGKHEKFRKLYGAKDDKWLGNELRYLSPYLLPIPINNSDKTASIKMFEEKGFASVIRLPFKNENALKRAVRVMESFDENTVLFLDRVKFLNLTSGKTQRLVERKVHKLHDPNDGQSITLEVIEDGAESYAKKKYLLWSIQIGGDENPIEKEDIVKAIAEDELPGRWPEVTRVKVSLAVRTDGELDKGLINIYLPTKLPTGCAAHFNGPFYGDMSRTHIDFGKKYNELLLKRIGRMAIEIVSSTLAGHDVDYARAIIDILSPSQETGQTAIDWFKIIQDVYEEKELQLNELPIMLTDKEWTSIGYTSLIPEIDTPTVLTSEVLREQATFGVIHKNLMNRKNELNALFDACSINPLPRDKDLAETVENVAAEMHKTDNKADWNGFWYDLIKLFKNDAEPLKGRKIILGNDSKLHASGEECTIFFPPRQGVDDDEVQGGGVSSDIPQSLRDYIAFIDDRIEIYNPKDARQQTPIRKFVESSLIERYRVIEIIRSVLIPRIPPLPISFRDKRKSRLCRDILLWGLKLVSGMPDRGRGRSGTLQLLRRLPVPCHGGWHPIEQTSFGPGWPNTVGTDVFQYLSGANTKECQAELARMLLPPTDKLWKGKGVQYKDLLELAGTLNGLKTIALNPNEWNARSDACKDSFKLPEASPPCIPDEIWSKYTSTYTPKVQDDLYYTGYFSYEVQPLDLIPGLDLYPHFDNETRVALMNSLFASIHKWEESWITVDVKKVEGMADRVSIESPLSYCLRMIPWLAIDSEGKKEWETPNRRWYIPKDCLAGRSWQYGHLRPLPGVLADKIDRNPALYDHGFAHLGMPKFVPDAETKSSNTRLLNDLATALDSEIPDRNMFLSHIRIAWSTFDTEDTSSFPDRIIISNGPKQLFAMEPDIKSPIYLPDSTASFVSELNQFSLPVIEINTPDAKRLSEQFKKKYGGAVRLASEMRVWPIVEGQEWLADTGIHLSESELGWLPIVLLTLYAFMGSSPPGIYAKKLSSSVQILRDTKVVWVSSLQAGLWMGDEIIANPPVAAMWISQDRILVCNKEFKDQVSRYSEALKTLIERDDLELPLKHFLEKIEHISTPTHEDLCLALQSLKIQRSQYDQAYDLWQGDLGQIIRMLMPVIALLKPDAEIGIIADIGSEEDLLTHLHELEIPRPTPQEMIGLIRSSDDYYMLGEKLFENLGTIAQLDQWNDALARVGAQQLTNKNAEEEYRTHLKTAQGLLGIAIAHIIRRNTEASQSFDEILEQMENIPFPDALASQYWEIEFEHALPNVIPFFEAFNAVSDEITAIKNAKSVEELKDSLSAVGVDVRTSPVVIHRKNHENFRNVLIEFTKIAMASRIKKNVSPLPWEKSPDELLSHFEDFVKHNAYLNLYSNTEYFDLLKLLPRDTAQDDFWNAVDQSSDLQSLITSLSLSASDILGADEALEKYKDRKRKQNRLTAVCGKEFDYSEDNLSQLWDHLAGQIDGDALPKVELKNLSTLEAIAKRQKKARTAGGKRGRPRGRTSKEMEYLIGFAGEIHAYRMLTKTYGEEVVHPGTWKSSYSSMVFPGNNPDDNIGCDFIINLKKVTYHIEVKSSVDDNESFELGSSEIRTAMEITRRRKRHVFMIMHVYDALSNNPGVRLLPNPYDPGSQNVYSIEDAGARIRYRLKSQ